LPVPFVLWVKAAYRRTAVSDFGALRAVSLSNRETALPCSEVPQFLKVLKQPLLHGRETTYDGSNSNCTEPSPPIYCHSVVIMLRIITAYTLLTLSAAIANESQTTDFASEKLFQIASKEENFYKRLAEDPEFYTEADMDQRVNELVQSYRAYLTEQPNDVSALILYGKLLRRVELYDEAFTAFLKADSLDPKLAVVKQQIGTHLAEQNKGRAALPFYLTAIELEPKTALYHFSLGQLLHQFRDDYVSEKVFTANALEREMLKAYRQAVNLEPENFAYTMRLGEAYYDMSSPDWRAALLQWNKALKNFGEMEPLRAEIINLHRANVLVKLGRLEEAQALTDAITHPNLQHSKQKVLDSILVH
jgi:cytochrome c-type biogenesis protein CcmH/NrfG